MEITELKLEYILFSYILYKTVRSESHLKFVEKTGHDDKNRTIPF